MEETLPVRLGCAHLGEVRHVCAFFSDDGEAYRVLLPFVADGFARGDKAIHVVRPDRTEVHRQHLRDAGTDVEAAEASGQLELRSSTETYLPEGRFDGDRMLAAFEAMAGGNNGYPRSRIVCEMDWAADQPAVLDALIRFEARVNDIWSRHQDVVICVYDLKKLSGDMVIDIMRTHPMVLIDEVLHENPFFMSPDAFLRERHERSRERVPVT